MRLYYHRDAKGNVGDDLNPWLWEQVLPGFFSGVMPHDPQSRENDQYSGPIFIGIGTLLNEHIPNKNCKAVFGTGTGYGKTKPLQNARVYALRGPLTAKKLGLPEQLAITDSAILVHRLVTQKPAISHKWGFIPHCSTIRQGNWEWISRMANVHLIRPDLSPDRFFQELLSCETVIAEAMHGAILADSLRIPWIPVKTHSGILDFKWQDWCASMKLPYRPCRLPSIWGLPENKSIIKTTKVCLKSYLAVLALNVIKKKVSPQRSGSSHFDTRLIQMEEALDRFQRDYKEGRFEQT